MAKNIDNSILVRLLFAVFKNISPRFKDTLTTSLDKLHDAAKETKNPFDDFIVEILRDILL